MIAENEKFNGQENHAKFKKIFFHNKIESHEKENMTIPRIECQTFNFSGKPI